MSDSTVETTNDIAGTRPAAIGGASASDSRAAGAEVPQDQVARHAIVYLPSIGGETGPDPTLDSVAARLARAYDDLGSATDDYRVIAGATYQDYGSDPVKYKTRVCTIARTGPDGKPLPVADLFWLDYAPAMTSKFEAKNDAMKVGYVAWALVSNAFAVVGAYPRLGGSNGTNLFVATAILMLVAAYFLILVVALAQTAPELTKVVEAAGRDAGRALAWTGIRPPQSASPEPSPGPVTASSPGSAQPSTPPSDSTTGGEPAAPLSFFQAIALLITSIGVIAPAKLKIRISRAGGFTACLLNYLSSSDQKAAVIGQFTALLDFVASRPLAADAPFGTAKYEHVTVVAYSFGSVIALDSLYPRSNPPSARYDAVTMLVTIGCPLNLITSIYPKYFTQRYAPGTTRDWVNVYSPDDLLGTNLSESAFPSPIQLRDGRRPIRPRSDAFNLEWSSRFSEHLSAIAPFLLIGFQRHSQYWERSHEDDAGCLRLVAEHLKRDVAASTLSEAPSVKVDV